MRRSRKERKREKAAKVKRLTGDKFKRFYQSAQWKRLRYDILVASDGRCECCGASAKDGVRLNVDHIEPLRKRWDLRLEPDNMQVLCGSCNFGKGNRHVQDWRRVDDALDAEFERALAADS